MRLLLIRLTRRQRQGCRDPSDYKNHLETSPETPPWTKAEILEDLTPAGALWEPPAPPALPFRPITIKPPRWQESHGNLLICCCRCSVFQYLWRTRGFWGNLGPFPLGRHTTTNQHLSPTDNPLKQGGRQAPKKRFIHGKGQWMKNATPHYADLGGKVIEPGSFMPLRLWPMRFSLQEYPPLPCLLACPSSDLLLQSVQASPPLESCGRLYYWSRYSPPLLTL